MTLHTDANYIGSTTFVCFSRRWLIIVMILVFNSRDSLNKMSLPRCYFSRKNLNLIASTSISPVLTYPREPIATSARKLRFRLDLTIVIVFFDNHFLLPWLVDLKLC